MSVDSPEEAIEILQPIHAMEQRSGHMISRKQLHTFLPSDLSFQEKRYLIRSWQDGMWERWANIAKWQMRESILKSDIGA